MASFTHNDTVDVKDYGEKNDDFLNTITDYSREAELARLYDIQLREKQREELLKGATKKGVTNYATLLAVQKSQELSPKYSTENISDSNENYSIDFEKKNSRSFWLKEAHQKKVEKIIASLTLSLLESVRLWPLKIKTMEDHPQIRSYIKNCLVMVSTTDLKDPSLKLLNNPYTIMQIIDIFPSELPNAEYPFDLVLLELDCTNSCRMSVAEILDKPFDENDLQFIQHIIRKKCLESNHILLDFADTLMKTSRNLKQFGFTEKDVADILKKKNVKDSTMGKAAKKRYAERYREMEELKTQINHLQSQLADQKNDCTLHQSLMQSLKKAQAKIKEIGQEMSQLEMEACFHLKEETKTKRLQKPETSDLFICGGTTSRKSTLHMDQPFYELQDTLSFQTGLNSLASLQHPTRESLLMKNEKTNPILLHPLRFVRSVIARHNVTDTKQSTFGTTTTQDTYEKLHVNMGISVMSMLHEDRIMLTCLDAFHEETEHLEFLDHEILCPTILSDCATPEALVVESNKKVIEFTDIM